MCGKRWKDAGRCNSFIYHVMINVGVNDSSPFLMKINNRVLRHKVENMHV